jgi:hypothetical protein
MHDLWVGGHPRGGGLGLPIGQNVDDLVSVQVHDDRAKRPAELKREIVEAKTLHMFCRLAFSMPRGDHWSHDAEHSRVPEERLIEDRCLHLMEVF